MNLENFYINVKKSDKFSPKSFVGKFILQGVWSDKDYWKLDSVLIEIYKFYKNKKLPKDIFAGIISIVADICGICEKSEIYITNKCYGKNSDNVIPDLYNRYERLNVLCKCIIYKDKFEDICFWYNKKEI
ncbi:Imm41 family immunity protein [Campylobacter ureolyticus]|uniref:Immunity protein 41 n=1 Tax=Campylobacter ureolyticus TaxID=827 RepID=A0AAE7EBA7_9BACT|nr:Imm41 family immunity protein [Campylobacter ureolyticus]MCR8685631.1 immunity 41 family protein [Campylobacter ureolyticus]MDU5326334.1 Imm41 family immunity protein [Campylobacter ureolyticus]QKF85089.1 immunity protein 41 [Campylobacter ureolyticus]QQY36430.1 hypothetical protein I6I59_04180 [Campylobacter ureolyticus]SUX25617.1 Uncharacterised protein [Campylobacter ureolyticus]